MKKSPLVLGSALLVLAACASETDGGAFASDQFAGQHAEEIDFDCTQSVQCTIQKGEPLPDGDPIEACVMETANLLNRDSARQDKFLANIGRCAGSFVTCDYVTCANAEGAAFGETKRAELQVYCAAEVQCNISNGVTGNTQATCVELKVRELNSFIPMRQQQWMNAYDICMSMGGCPFVDCFNSAFLGAIGP